jgi:hypothetical protein
MRLAQRNSGDTKFEAKSVTIALMSPKNVKNLSSCCFAVIKKYEEYMLSTKFYAKGWKTFRWEAFFCARFWMMQ